MAQKQVAARLMGDDYQGRFFWFQAAQLLYDNSHVARVVLEHDEVTHVDDVAVYYHAPGKREGDRLCAADFYQVKFHVDQSSVYCSDGLMDPGFTGSTTSLLQRFFKAYKAQRDQIPWFTLNLVSNWVWDPSDKLAAAIRHSGALPDEFFSASRRASLGKIRQHWIDHLGTDEDILLDFCRRLRLKLNFFGTADLNCVLSDRLFRAGLLPLDPAALASPYDDLARKFITSQMTSFDKVTLRDVCANEGLIRSAPRQRTMRTIGIRSFIPFAENMESECDDFLCVSSQFDGRHPRTEDTWELAAAAVCEFLAGQRPRLVEEHRVVLDCHSTLAFLAGYVLTQRACAFPAGPRPRLEVQRPTVGADSRLADLWTPEMFEVDARATDLAVAISVTHKASPQVLAFLHAAALPTSHLLELCPAEGVGRSSVRDADHAIALATSLVSTVRSHVGPGRRIHLFPSTPNFLAYFVGQQARALGELILYEYDFDGPEPRSYQRSLAFPRPKAVNAPEIDYGTVK